MATITKHSIVQAKNNLESTDGVSIFPIFFLGYQLGGDFAGTVAPAGSTFTVGHWYIVKRWCNGVPSDGYIWRVRSARPGNIALIGQARTTSGEFDVMSPRWGEGKAFNVAKYSFDGSGNADAILRNVISF